MRREGWWALTALSVGGLYAGTRVLGIYWDFGAASSELPRTVQEYRAVGLPWTAADLDRQVAPKDNAAPLIRRAIAAWPRGKDPIGLYDPVLSKALREGAVARLPRYAKALDLAHQAARFPALDFERDWDLGPDLTMPEHGGIKAIVRLLAARAELRAARNDDAGALDDLDDARRLGVLVGQEPDRIASAAAQTCLVRAAGNPARLVRYRDGLAKAPPLPDFRQALRGELYLKVALGRNLDRLGVGHAFWPQTDLYAFAMVDGPDEMAGRSHPSPVPTMRRDGLPENVRARAYFARCLQMWTELARTTDGFRDPSTGARSMAVASRYENARGMSHGLDAILFPIYSQATRTSRLAQASRALTRAFADALIRHARIGRWSTAVTTPDPLGSGPLRVRFDGGRFRVWSVGPNGRDENGLASREADAAGKRSDDLVAAYPPIPLKIPRTAPPPPSLYPVD